MSRCLPATAWRREKPCAPTEFGRHLLRCLQGLTCSCQTTIGDPYAPVGGEPTGGTNHASAYDDFKATCRCWWTLTVIPQGLLALARLTGDKKDSHEVTHMRVHTTLIVAGGQMQKVRQSGASNLPVPEPSEYDHLKVSLPLPPPHSAGRPELEELSSTSRWALCGELG